MLFREFSEMNSRLFVFLYILVAWEILPNYSVIFHSTDHDVISYNSQLMTHKVSFWINKERDCLRMCLDRVHSLEPEKLVTRFHKNHSRCDCYEVEEFIFNIQAAPVVEDMVSYINRELWPGKNLDDADQCAEVAGLCNAETEVCQRNGSSYYCHCLEPDLPVKPTVSWTSIYVYNANSDTDFLTMFEAELLAVGSAKYDDIIGADEILLVICDDQNNRVEELVFRATSDLWSWFAVDNLISSSLWSIDFSASSVVFDTILEDVFDSGLEITTQDDNVICETTGYLKMFCSETAMCNMPNSTKCHILYSPTAKPLAFKHASRASKLELYARNIRGFAEKGSLIFQYRVQSGLDFWEFYSGNFLKLSPDDNNFRHPNFKTLLIDADKITLTVYDDTSSFSPVIIGHVTFDLSGKFHDWLSWMEVGKLSIDGNSFKLKSSSEGHVTFKDFSHGVKHFLEIRDGSQYTNCNSDYGWLSVRCYDVNGTLDEVLGCVNEKWFTNNTCGMLNPCRIFYSLYGTFWKSGTALQATSLALHTTTSMNKVLRYESMTLIKFSDFLKQKTDNGWHAGSFSAHNIEDLLSRCSKIKLKIIPEAPTKENIELHFSCGSSFSDWFSSSKLLDSSYWDRDLLGSANFKIQCDARGNRVMCIKQNNKCDMLLLVSCDDSCAWQTNSDGVCQIYYSDISTNSMVGARALEFWVDSFPPFFGSFSIPWKLVFTIGTFSNVDSLDYFNTGSTTPKVNGFPVLGNGIFRHPKMIDQISSASKIRMLYYDFEGENIFQEFIFNGNGESLDWFSKDTLEYSSLWNLDFEEAVLRPYDSLSSGGLFFTAGNFTSCEDSVVFSILKLEEDTTGCYANVTWVDPDPNEVSNIDSKAPLLLYSDKAEGRDGYFDFLLGSKISIFVS